MGAVDPREETISQTFGFTILHSECGLPSKNPSGCIKLFIQLSYIGRDSLRLRDTPFTPVQCREKKPSQLAEL